MSERISSWMRSRAAAADDPAAGRGMFAYRDSWGQGGGAYLQMIHERLVLLRELLSDQGTIYVHCDYRVSHYLRAILDETFGPQNYRNELIWCYRGGGVPRNDFAAKHDTIFRYSKSDKYIFNADEVRIPYSPDVQASLASRYDKSYRANKVYEGYRPNVLGKHPEDWWLIQPIMPSDRTERLDYPTQKPIELIQRIVDASSMPGQPGSRCVLRLGDDPCRRGRITGETRDRRRQATAPLLRCRAPPLDRRGHRQVRHPHVAEAAHRIAAGAPRTWSGLPEFRHSMD